MKWDDIISTSIRSHVKYFNTVREIIIIMWYILFMRREARTERRTIYGGVKRERGEEGWMEVVVIK